MKKVISLFTTLTLSLTLLAGCGSEMKEMYSEEDFTKTYVSGFEFDILKTFVSSGSVGYYENADFYFDIEVYEGETKEEVLSIVENNFVLYQQMQYSDLYESHRYLEETESGFIEITVDSGDTYEYNIVSVNYNDESTYSLCYLLVDNYSIYLGVQCFDATELESATFELLDRAIMSVKYQEPGDMTIRVANFDFDIPNSFVTLGYEGYYGNESFYFNVEIFTGETLEDVYSVVLDDFLGYQQLMFADTFESVSFKYDTESGFERLTINNGLECDYNIMTIKYDDDTAYSLAYMVTEGYSFYVGIQSFSEETEEEALEILFNAINTMNIND